MSWRWLHSEMKLLYVTSCYSGSYSCLLVQSISLLCILVHDEFTYLWCRVELDVLKEGFEIVKHYCEAAVEALELISGSCCQRLATTYFLCTSPYFCCNSGLFQFLRKLHSRVYDSYNQFRCWSISVHQLKECDVDQEMYSKQLTSTLVEHVLLCVQHVILRHEKTTKAG